MTWQEFEQKVANTLDEANISYTWEQARIRYGGKAGKGKCDFILKNSAIECKVVDGLNQFKFPGVNPDTHKLYRTPSLKPHQMAFLRKHKERGHIFVYNSKKNTYNVLSVRQMEQLIIDNPRIRSLAGHNEFQVNYDDFMKEVINDNK